MSETPVHLGRIKADLRDVLSYVPMVNSTLPFLFCNITGTRSGKLGAQRAHRSVYH